MKRVTTIESERNYTDPKRDQANEIEIPLKNNKIRIIRTGPHGFWEITYEKGRTPDQFRGQWISIADAKKVIKSYLISDGRLYQVEGDL